MKLKYRFVEGTKTVFAIQMGFSFDCCLNCLDKSAVIFLSAVLNLTFHPVHMERNGHLLF